MFGGFVCVLALCFGLCLFHSCKVVWNILAYLLSVSCSHVSGAFFWTLLLIDGWHNLQILIVLYTRKSKTEAVLQRRSMLKFGVICKFMNRYGKCFMS